MAATPFGKGLNGLLVVFSLLVVGGAAYVMSTNQAILYKSGASNVTETATGKLVKKGMGDFGPCSKANAAYSYGLLGAQPETRENAQNKNGKGKEREPAKTPACTPLSVQASLADPLVGQRVVATGTLQNGIFYATALVKEGAQGKCTEQCPGKDGVLRNCHPAESDGTSADSLCNSAGRVETCGTQQFCCPKAGGTWTTNVSLCKVTPTPVSSAKPTRTPIGPPQRAY